MIRCSGKCTRGGNCLLSHNPAVIDAARRSFSKPVPCPVTLKCFFVVHHFLFVLRNCLNCLIRQVTAFALVLLNFSIKSCNVHIDHLFGVHLRKMTEFKSTERHKQYGSLVHLILAFSFLNSFVLSVKLCRVCCHNKDAVKQPESNLLLLCWPVWFVSQYRSVFIYQVIQKPG